MIKFLHIIAGLNVGGAEMMLMRLIQSHQNNKSFSHSVISLTSIGKVGESLNAIGIDVYVLDMKNVFDIPRKFLKLIKIIRFVNPDIVQTWMYHADLLGGIASHFAGYRRVIWGIRSTEISSGVSRSTLGIRKFCALLSWWIPIKIVCVADASRRSHIAVGYDPSRMVVINNGFDINVLVATESQRTMLRQECGFGFNDIVIGIIGRFNPVKDFENFVRAAGFVANKNQKVRFLMVGRGLESNNIELVSWLAKTEQANKFVLLGERPDIPACLASMDIFCLSSRSEGFPNVVGEAMATGLPCVVTDVGDAGKLVGDFGIVVPKEDSIALAQGLFQVLAMSSESRRDLGHNAKSRIHALFTMEQSLNRFEKLYRDLIKIGNK